MIHLPVKCGEDLSSFLRSFDNATESQFARTRGIPCFNWFSVVVIPSEALTERLQAKYGNDLSPGFCEFKVVPPSPEPMVVMNEVFPNLAALAGYVTSGSVPRGWISYKDEHLMICSGEAKKPESSPPPGLAFEGCDRHSPSSPDHIMFQCNVHVNSVHQFFCICEGLLKTLSI